MYYVKILGKCKVFFEKNLKNKESIYIICFWRKRKLMKNKYVLICRYGFKF